MKSRQKIFVALILVAAIALSLVATLIHLLTESWWFDSVGLVEVFWTRLTWQIVLGVSTFTIYALFLWGNYWLALRLSRERPFRFFQGTTLEYYSQTIANLGAFLFVFLVSLGVARDSAEAWETVLKSLNSTKANLVDPVFERDLGFYLFKLPLYQELYRWLLTLIMAALMGSVAVYVLKEKLRFNNNWRSLLPKDIKTHLSFLLAAIALLVAFNFWLQRYELLYSSGGVVFGAGYTDTHARLIAYGMMTVLALLLSGVFIGTIRQRNLALPIWGIGLSLAAAVVILGLYPWFQQRFVVEPNELAKEQPYILHNLEFTRKAYDLESVQSQDFPAQSQLNRQDLLENRATVNNIRLWDYRPLLSTYRQLQEIRLYYLFNDVDVDRYTLNGNYRQVMLAARELAYDQIPQQGRTWVNQRLKYTHGYGVVMSPVNVVTQEGLPQLFIKNIPPDSEVDLQVEQPAIYYGEETDTYIFTGTSTPEFDYPLGDENAFTTYDGEGGVPIPSLWQRLAYAYELGNLKIILSDYFTSDSRLHYYRQIQQRVSKVAPFLKFDNDPYITVIDGRLQWIVDAYTVSDRYPYSEPVALSYDAAAILRSNDIESIIGDNVNYIRNSVKVVVDAFNGTMQFYGVDEDDPLLATYRKIFPSLFQRAESVPPAVKAHFRYPLDLFNIQAQMFLSYHMNDPQVFYNQEDLWRFPTEVYEDNEQPIEPYYLIMRLPEEAREEFVLILPFTPANKDNMIAWMAARSDGENYGKLLLYEFPKQTLVYGPSQIEARINQNPSISEQLTLWDQEGSRVIRGNLLVIPIEESLLYVESVYLRAEQGELPELKRVIVSYDKEIVMEESLEQALLAVFGGGQGQPPATETAIDSPLAQSALEVYQRAQEALQQGNWAEYGRYQQELGSILQQMESGRGE